MPHLSLKRAHISEDGTTKLLLDAGNAPLETVVIPTERRTTVCVSSQSGCARGCTFCATAKMGLGRNLTAGEIVAQVVLATNYAPASVPVRNVVFMGMGEPMDNLDEVLRAIDIMTEDAGLGLGARFITVSSVGVLPKMEEFVRRSRARLAISLNATSDETRGEIMPVNRRWDIHELLDFIDRWATEDRPILVEYILMAGVNDSLVDAQRLSQMMGGMAVRMNLIPLNPHPGSPFERPTPESVDVFHRFLVSEGMAAFVRKPRGDEIAAACGQLNRPEVRTNRSMKIQAAPSSPKGPQGI